MRKLIYLGIVLVSLLSCTKENEKQTVKYRVSNATAATNIAYRNEESVIINQTVDFDSPEDIWTHSTEMNLGDIVYLSAVYYDSTSSVTVEVIVDGKIYKQRSSVNEPEKYVIASGTVPYK